MSVAAPKNTLLYQRRGRPLALKRSLAEVGIKEVAAKIRGFGTTHGEKYKPETEAIQFYLANHAMKELEFAFDMEEPLPTWAVEIADEYQRVAARIAARAFYYLVLITAREARHEQNKSATAAKAKDKFGLQALAALKEYPDSASIDSVTGVFDKYGNGMTLGDMARSVQFCFYNGSFHGGYGGKKWGNVADCLVNYVVGEYTAETMLDTVWTLVHNGGPIFNKGMLYQCQDNASLQQVLDIQRAGMIPRLVLAPYNNGMVSAEKYVNEGARKFAQKVAEYMPNAKDFKAIPVDFAEVQKLGAVGSYGSLVQKLHGKTPMPGASSPFAPKPKHKSSSSYGSDLQPMAAASTKPTEKTHYIIANAPGLMFKKLTREELSK